ncbi:MAG: aminotransferase class V-fold PLP-dependent enzyme [Actinomycetia bacterium]|nr:aminotransferase class V-fold PLP-dependent enzyme [Actinomycetes bacterium]
MTDHDRAGADGLADDDRPATNGAAAHGTEPAARDALAPGDPGGPDWLRDAPVFTAWQAATRADTAPFLIPGHKRRAGDLDADLGRLLWADVPLYGGLDTVKLSHGTLAEAERRGARLWGADWCRYSTGGSTHANQALCLALGQPGDTVLVTRSLHRSTLLGLVLAGLRPVWLPTELDERFGLPSGLSLDGLRRAIAAHPEAVAVLCVEPSYLGTVSDLAAVVAIAHEAGLAVVVDQAWGAHFGFAPGYPPHALALGADALVTSAHKTLPAFSQGSIALARGDRLDRDRLERAFEAGHTTSPSGAILASVDASRALLASPMGRALLDRMRALVDESRRELAALGLRGPGPEDFPPGRFDPAKLVLSTAAAGVDGLELESELIAAGLPVELADRDLVVPLVALVDTPATLRRLLDAVAAFARRAPRHPRPVTTPAAWRLSAGEPALTPREAFFARHRRVPVRSAIGAVSAELVAPYPPGIPVLVPGEVITGEVVELLADAVAAGARIAYAADPTLRTLQVVDGAPVCAPPPTRRRTVPGHSVTSWVRG